MHKLTRIILIIVALGMLSVGAAALWYVQQLKPVNTTGDNVKDLRFVVEKGDTSESIAQVLKEKEFIRHKMAFKLYVKLSNQALQLKEGVYFLKNTETVEEIVNHLTSGKPDEFTMTFIPGDTLKGHKQSLMKAGYSEEEITVAFSKLYDHPLLNDAPKNATLEGFIYGETYVFAKGTSVEDIITRTLDEMYRQVTENDLAALYKKQGLSLFEGITLASIIQKEVISSQDMKQVAQVFYKRMKIGETLGADATFVYIADQMGITPSTDIDSPYNTRKHAGLPPGPISSPSKDALLAVAHPAPGDYLFYVSGDDGRNHFSKTNAEHEALTQRYCIENCALF